MRTRGSEWIATGAAVLFCALWAGAYVATKVALRDMPPLSLLAIRFGLAGLILAALVVVLREPWPRRELWPRIVGLGLLTNAIYLGLMFQGLRFTSAGLASVLASTNPLMLAAIAPLTIGERPARRTVAGLVLGFLGVVGVMLPRLGGGGAPGDSPLGALLCLAAVLSLTLSTVVFKKLPPDAPLLAVTAGQVLAAALATLPVAVATEQVLPRVAFSPAGWWSFLFLVLGLTVGASLIWFWLLGRGEATRVSAWFFLVPILGIALGTLFLSESFGPRELPGLAAVSLGILLVNRQGRPELVEADGAAPAPEAPLSDRAR